MRRIIYAWNYPEWGGVQIYFLSLIKEARKKFDVIAVLPENSEGRLVRSLQDLDVRLVYSPPVYPHSQPKGLSGRIRRRSRIISTESKFVKVLLAQIEDSDTIIQVDLGFWHSALSIVRLCRKAHVFYTIHTALVRHSLFRDILWKLKGFMVSGSPKTHFLASNEDARRSLSGYIGKHAFEETVVTYAGFDPEEIEIVEKQYPGRNAILEKHDLPDRPLIVTVGQFIERKGRRVVAESLRILRGRGYDFTFVWLSTVSPDAGQLRAVDGFGLGDEFRIMSSDELAGSRMELFSIVRSAEVFVLASLQEGLPIALVEAMALGSACIATNINAIPEAIENGVSGVVIEPNDAMGLAEELSKLIDDPDRRSSLGIAAKAIAFERFSEKATADLTMKLYEAVWSSAAIAL